MQKLFLIFLLTPIFAQAQIPHSQSAATYYQSNVGTYKQMATDSVFSFKNGTVNITTAAITVDGVSYPIISSDTEFTDANNDWWKIYTLANGMSAIVHRQSNYELASLYIGNKSYYIY